MVILRCRSTDLMQLPASHDWPDIWPAEATCLDSQANVRSVQQSWRRYTHKCPSQPLRAHKTSMHGRRTAEPEASLSSASFPHNAMPLHYPQSHAAYAAAPVDYTHLEIYGTIIDAPSPGKLRIRRNAYVLVDIGSGQIKRISQDQRASLQTKVKAVRLPRLGVVVPGFVDCVSLPGAEGGLGADEAEIACAVGSLSPWRRREVGWYGMAL
jgi:hypothetical protein